MSTVLPFALLSCHDVWLVAATWLLTGLGRAQVDATPVIWENFITDGCESLPGNVSRQVPLRSLLDEGFFLQLDIYGTYTPRLLAAKAPPCVLPGSEMYRVKRGKTYKQHFEVLFETVTPVEVTSAEEEAKEKEEEGEEEGNEGLEAGERKETPRKVATNCNFPTEGGGIVRLKSGYGFLSCRGENDVDAARAALQAWREDVRREEARAASTKIAVMGGIGGGMAALVLFCVVCVMLRLRATRGRERSRRRTRHLTPPRSASTRLTNDPMSSTQQSALNSR
ncbi:uncharacterized protein LOC125031315 isoform X1 [Penaeus chinensis]|uniref:uncharacterized protein LOC125031315 isoform X1 n=1 Tax=Penaeus chinensis TaxID=139456 RepID=UPI001FB5A848|nr:uncharacterized protein LOC125031315 isoform X1 [Penaeus chinensis]